MKKKTIILFSGGTGGHVIPAVNFGNFLLKKGFNCIIFLDERGIKYSKKFNGKIVKIYSSHFTGNFFFKIKAMLLLIVGFLQSFFYLFLIRPSYCIGFGGYATSMPLITCIPLNFLNVTKIYLHEQNSRLGKVNIFFSFISKYIFLNFKVDHFYNKNISDKSFHVGLPINEKYIFLKRDNTGKKKSKYKIFVYGGSQGSVNLNNNVINWIEKLPNEYSSKISLIFQSQNEQISLVKEKLKNQSFDIEINNFYGRIDEVLNNTDMVISRAGAGTINDIIFSQVPSILIPFPYSVDNHQYYNAKYLIDQKAAILIKEHDMKKDFSFLKFKDLIDKIEIRKQLTLNLQLIKKLNANDLMYEKIFNENKK